MKKDPSIASKERAMPLRLTLAALILVPALGCGGSQQQQEVSGWGTQRETGEATPPPDWMTTLEVGADRLCGYGVAGAGYNKHSPYPKRLAEERAVKNLAGVLGTRVQEAIIDRETLRGTSVRTAHVLTVDEALIEKVKGLAETEYWLDVEGEGPFAAPGFTYAHTCIDASIAADTFELDAAELTGADDGSLISPDQVPDWLDDAGKKSDGRLCAIGFSLPTFHPDKTFQKVVEDVRWQLSEVIKTFVSTYFEELTTTRFQAMESMTLATTEGVSKGVIVTHYWYDRDGSGPVGEKRSTYGLGCVYPVEILVSSAAAVEEAAPEDEKEVIRKVRERAQSAFDDLDAEIEKREGADPT